MDLPSEIVQTGLPRPDPAAGIEQATTENIDFDYEILDVESQILDVALKLYSAILENLLSKMLSLIRETFCSVIC